MGFSGYAFSFDWEVSLIEKLQETITGAASAVVSFFSAFGEELLLVLIIGFFYWSYDKKLGRFVGQNLLVSTVLCPMIKNIALRRRPYFDHERIRILRLVDSDADPFDIAAQGFSLPSGHSASAAVTYGSIYRYVKKKSLLVLSLLLPLLVGFSRIFVGAHYPTDVLAGFLIGTLVLFLVPMLERTIPRRSVFCVLLALLCAPGLFYCTSNDYFTSYGMLIGFIFGSFFEEKKVRFENTRSPVRMVLRVLGGGGLFLLFQLFLKLLFTEKFISGGSYPALLIRAVCYAMILFLLVGVYPIVFRYTARFFAGGQKNVHGDAGISCTEKAASEEAAEK